MYNNYPEELIEEVRINNDILDVVSQYVKLEKKGRDYFGLCPFHKEKTPSFSVAAAKQIYYCFGCGKGGNVIHFIMSIENLDFINAVKFLADRARIQLPDGDGEEEKNKARIRQEIIKINTEAARFFYGSLNGKEGEKARQYLKNRSIGGHIIRKFGIGYSPEEWSMLYNHLSAAGFDEELIAESGLVLKNKKGGFYDRFRSRIMFPIFDIRGNIIGFGGRVTDSSMPKYMNSPETKVYNKSKNLYALNMAKNSGEKQLIVVEGYMDVISLHQNGIINTVASLGTALTESQGRILKKYAEEIVIAYDADMAGQAATLRGLDLLNDIGCNVKVLQVPEGKDPDEYIRRNGAESFRGLLKGSVSLIEYKLKLLKKQTPTDEIEGKIVFLNKAAELMAKVDNLVEREMYVKKFSSEYDISPEALNSEIYKRLRPKGGFKALTGRPAGPVKKSGATNENSGEVKAIYDERMLLVLLCSDSSIYRTVKADICIDDFTDEYNKHIVQMLVDRLDENKTVTPAELMNLLDSGHSSEFARIVSEVSRCEDYKKAVYEKIKSIKLHATEKRMKELQSLLSNDSDSLQKGDVEKLKSEYISLAVKLKEQKSL